MVREMAGPRHPALLALPVLLAGAAILMALGPGRATGIETPGPLERFDERDTVFAWEEYLPGSEKYDEYYSLHPERKDRDDKRPGQVDKESRLPSQVPPA